MKRHCLARGYFVLLKLLGRSIFANYINKYENMINLYIPLYVACHKLNV